MQRRDTKKMTPGPDAGRMNKRKFESGVAYAGKTVGNKGRGKGGGVMLDDETIIELFFARSERAIGELAQKYGKLCHRLSHNIVNDRLEAEECVNDAYLAPGTPSRRHGLPRCCPTSRGSFATSR